MNETTISEPKMVYNDLEVVVTVTTIEKYTDRPRKESVQRLVRLFDDYRYKYVDFVKEAQKIYPDITSDAELQLLQQVSDYMLMGSNQEYLSVHQYNEQDNTIQDVHTIYLLETIADMYQYTEVTEWDFQAWNTNRNHSNREERISEYEKQIWTDFDRYMQWCK